MNGTDSTLPYGPLCLYRGACVRLLRQYFNTSVELGRLPSILGREFFRSSHECEATSFEKHVVFVIDVEHTVQQLDPFEQQLISRVVLQEHAKEEAAVLLRCGLRTVERRLPEVLDKLSDMLLRRDLLRALPNVPEKSFDDEDGCEEWAEGDTPECVPNSDIRASAAATIAPVEICCQGQSEGCFNASV